MISDPDKLAEQIAEQAARYNKISDIWEDVTEKWKRILHQPIDKETAKSVVKQLYQLAERTLLTFEFVPSPMAAINLANKLDMGASLRDCLELNWLVLKASLHDNLIKEMGYVMSDFMDYLLEDDLWSFLSPDLVINVGSGHLHDYLWASLREVLGEDLGDYQYWVPEEMLNFAACLDAVVTTDVIPYDRDKSQLWVALFENLSWCLLYEKVCITVCSGNK